MDEDVFNIQIRKFLKNVGVTSQREIERAVREALSSGKISNGDVVPVRAVLEIESLDVQVEIDGKIALT